MFCFFSTSHKFFSLHSSGFRKAQGTFLALIWGNYYMQENLPHAATSLKSLSSYLGGLRSGSCDDLLKHQSSVLDALPVDAVNLLRAQKHKWDISTASSLRGNISSEWENHTSLMRMMMYLATSCKQMLTKQGWQGRASEQKSSYLQLAHGHCCTFLCLFVLTGHMTECAARKNDYSTHGSAEVQQSV